MGSSGINAGVHGVIQKPQKMISTNNNYCPNCWGYQEYHETEMIQGFECVEETKNTKKMSTFNVPTGSEVSENNQVIFDNLQKALGFVPNLYATYAHSETALQNYLNFSNAKTSLSAKEKEVVNLAVSQVNECIYCLSAHTA